MSDRNETNDGGDKSPVKESTRAGEALMPSLQDMQNFQKNAQGTDKSGAIDPCGPDYIDFSDGTGASNSQPTESRLAKDQQIRDALNGPQPDRPATDDEKRAAQQGLKTLEDYQSSIGRDFDKSLEAGKRLQEQFGSLDPKAADGVLSEMNKTLEPQGMRVVRTPSGEVWLGGKGPNGTYFMQHELGKADNCAVS